MRHFQPAYYAKQPETEREDMLNRHLPLGTGKSLLCVTSITGPDNLLKSVFEKCSRSGGFTNSDIIFVSSSGLLQSNATKY